MVRQSKDSAFSESEIVARSRHNSAMLRKAHARLSDLTTAAESDSFHGVVTVEVYFEAGRVTAIRRRSDGTDR